MDVQQSLSDGIKLIQAELDRYTKVCADRKEQLQSLMNSIAIADDRLSSANKETERVILENKAALSGMMITIDEKQHELKKVEYALLTAKSELDVTIKKQAQFMQYQSRAQKALQARENSILEREKELEETAELVKRRHSILDNAL